MYKRTLSFIILVLLAVAIHGTAQSVTVPEFVTFVMPKNNSVNIRKAPSAQSTKLVWQQTGAQFWEGKFVWADAAGTPVVPAMKRFTDMIQYPAFPVIEETGDWYHILFHVMECTFDAYILKSLCTRLEQRDITESYVSGYLEYDLRRQGKYKYYTLLLGRLYANDGPGEVLFIGKVKEGVCVGKEVNPMLLDNEQAIELYCEISNDRELESVTDEQIDKLLGYVADSPTEYLYGVPGIYQAWTGEKTILDPHFGIYCLSSEEVDMLNGLSH